MKDEHFKNELDHARNELFTESLGRIKANIQKAVDKLVELMEWADKQDVQCRAVINNVRVVGPNVDVLKLYWDDPNRVLFDDHLLLFVGDRVTRPSKIAAVTTEPVLHPNSIWLWCHTSSVEARAQCQRMFVIRAPYGRTSFQKMRK
jgi:hypothetical protein